MGRVKHYSKKTKHQHRRERKEDPQEEDPKPQALTVGKKKQLFKQGRAKEIKKKI